MGYHLCFTQGLRPSNCAPFNTLNKNLVKLERRDLHWFNSRFTYSIERLESYKYLFTCKITSLPCWISLGDVYMWWCHNLAPLDVCDLCCSLVDCSKWCVGRMVGIMHLYMVQPKFVTNDVFFGNNTFNSFRLSWFYYYCFMIQNKRAVHSG